jgi:hypothetical protein
MLHKAESIRKSRRRCVDGQVKPGHDREAQCISGSLGSASDQQLTL